MIVNLFWKKTASYFQSEFKLSASEIEVPGITLVKSVGVKKIAEKGIRKIISKIMTKTLT